MGDIERLQQAVEAASQRLENARAWRDDRQRAIDRELNIQRQRKRMVRQARARLKELKAALAKAKAAQD